MRPTHAHGEKNLTPNKKNNKKKSTGMPVNSIPVQLHLSCISVRLTPSCNGASVVLFLCLVLSVSILSSSQLPLTQLPPSPIKIVEMCVVNEMHVHL